MVMKREMFILLHFTDKATLVFTMEVEIGHRHQFTR